MRRRDCLAAIVSIMFGPEALAQPSGKVSRIAVVHSALPIAALNEKGGHPPTEALFQELRRIGYVEGQNIIIDRYSGEGRSHLSRELAERVITTKPLCSRFPADSLSTLQP